MEGEAAPCSRDPVHILTFARTRSQVKDEELAKCVKQVDTLWDEWLGCFVNQAEARSFSRLQQQIPHMLKAEGLQQRNFDAVHIDAVRFHSRRLSLPSLTLNIPQVVLRLRAAFKAYGVRITRLRRTYRSSLKGRGKLSRQLNEIGGDTTAKRLLAVEKAKAMPELVNTFASRVHDVNVDAAVLFGPSAAGSSAAGPSAAGPSRLPASAPAAAAPSAISSVDTATMHVPTGVASRAAAALADMTCDGEPDTDDEDDERQDSAISRFRSLTLSHQPPSTPPMAARHRIAAPPLSTTDDFCNRIGYDADALQALAPGTLVADDSGAIAVPNPVFDDAAEPSVFDLPPGLLRAAAMLFLFEPIAAERARALQKAVRTLSGVLCLGFDPFTQADGDRFICNTCRSFPAQSEYRLRDWLTLYKLERHA
jgi:hypothetical protein